MRKGDEPVSRVAFNPFGLENKQHVNRNIIILHYYKSSVRCIRLTWRAELRTGLGEDVYLC